MTPQRSRWQERRAHWWRIPALGVMGPAVAVVLLSAADAASAQRLNLYWGVDVTGTASSNPDLAPKGEEQSDAWLVINPYFGVTGTVGNRFRLTGGGSLGASARLSLRGQDSFSTYIRPSGGLDGTWEVVDNFFYVDVRARASTNLDSPFLATTDPTSPVNTTTAYQAGIAPYIKGRLLGEVFYQVRSDHAWTDQSNARAQYSAHQSVLVERAPQPFGFAVSADRYVQDILSSDEPTRVWSIARLSLRYSPISSVALGVRGGWEKYDFLSPPLDEARTFYGVEASWRPNPRTVLEGYWEDRYFGDSWRMRFSYRRPLVAFNIQSSRDLTTTPQQYVTFPGLSSLASLVDAAFTTRIPDPVERQRAVIDFLSRSQLPRELLTPTIVYDERITLETDTTASIVYYGKRHSLALTAWRRRTEGVFGVTSVPEVLADNLQRGVEATFSRRMTPIMSFSTTASWRRTESLLDPEDNYTTQTQLRMQLSRQLGQRTDGTLGARYQWITSTVTNDANEAAVYFTLTYRSDY